MTQSIDGLTLATDTMTNRKIWNIKEVDNRVIAVSYYNNPNYYLYKNCADKTEVYDPLF